MPAKGQKITEEHRAAIRAAAAGRAIGQSPQKTCPKCRETKPRKDFGLRAPNAQGKVYSKSYCKQCENLISTEKHRGDPERTKARNKVTSLSRYFDMTPDQYQELLEQQGGVCAICREEAPADSRLHIDHDHSDGQVRGLLCRDCNHGLGRFKDDPVLLERAIAYLASPRPSLADGTTFSYQGREAKGRQPKRPIPADLAKLSLDLRDLRSGRTKVSVSRATGLSVSAIGKLENPAIRTGRVEDLFTLLNLYDTPLVVSLQEPFDQTTLIAS